MDDNNHPFQGGRFYALRNEQGTGLVGELGPLLYSDLERDAPDGQAGAWGAVNALERQGEQILCVEVRVLGALGPALPKRRGLMEEKDWAAWHAALEADMLRPRP